MTDDHQPKISIILPTYNGAKYLRNAIQSCLNQTYRNIELIIVDDCSTDSTPDIIKSFNDPRIRSIRNAVNQRLPRSLNIGFAASTGEYLTWTSDDNELMPTTIEELLKYLKANPGIQFVYADMVVRNQETGETSIRRLGTMNLGQENNIGACYLYTREVYETTGDYDPRFEWVEDYDYWIRVSQKFQMRYFPKPLYIYGDHPQSLTSLRRYSIVLMKDILLHQRKYLTTEDLHNSIRQFAVNLKLHMSSLSDQQQAWQGILKKVFGISSSFGIYFTVQLFLLTLGRLAKFLITPFIWQTRRLNFLWIFRNLKKDGTRTNILCIIPYMLMGGSEQVLSDIIRGLPAERYNFHLIGMAKSNDAWCQRFSRQFSNVILLEDHADDVRFEQTMEKLIRLLNIHILFISNATVGYRCLPELKKKFPNLKAVDILHTENWGGTISKYTWVAPFLDKRACISHGLKKTMKRHYLSDGIDASYLEKIQVIHNGYDLPDHESTQTNKNKFRSKYNIGAKSKIISFVGRFSAEKQPQLFLEIAAELVKKSDHQWTFVMAGDGAELAGIKERVKQYGLAQYFVLPGMLTETSDLFWDTFLLLVVSQKEGIPLVIEEAFARHVPVISTNVGAVSELLKEGVNGYLIDTNEHMIEQFVTKIRLLADNPSLYQKIAAQTQSSMIPEFSFKTMSKSYRQLFESL